MLTRSLAWDTGLGHRSHANGGLSRNRCGYSGLGIPGGDEGDRTPDLRIANATLSQLSYIP